MKTPAILFLAFCLFVILEFQCKAQIEVTYGSEVTPEDLVEKIVGDGVIVDNISFQGSEDSRGIFTNGLSANLGINEGIFLSSGSGVYIPGPNISSSISTYFGNPGHPSLNQLCNCLTYDAAVLEFDFVSAYNTLKINYTFGSDEYPESFSFTGIDPLGIFITGPNPGGGYYYDDNITLVPGTNTRVAIHTINHNTNPEYYIDNTNGMFLEYDGFTVVLEATLPVVQCETYHIKIAVSDGGDHIIDSGIFLEENSLTSPAITTSIILAPPGLTENMVEGHVNATVVFRLPDTSYAPMTVCFDIDGTATNGVDYEWIDDCITFEEGQDSTTLTIVPLWDIDIIEGIETIHLIYEDTLGCEILTDTLELIIEDYLEMNPIMSPDMIICEGQQVDIGVTFPANSGTGYPPYTYLWEPGGYKEDTITVNPLENTNYVVTITDLFEETAQDSVLITVYPVCELESFYFEKSFNPGLPFDVYGEVTGDTVFVAFPAGTNLSALIPSYTFVNGVCNDTIGNINDFTNPVVYEFIAPGGCSAHWTVIGDIETGEFQNAKETILIFPNPSKDQITITNANGWNFTLLITIGQIVLEGLVSNYNHELNISGLKPGIYLMKFQKEDEVFVKRVVICR